MGACYYLNQINLNINHSINFNSHLKQALIHSFSLSLFTANSVSGSFLLCLAHCNIFFFFLFKSILCFIGTDVHNTIYTIENKKIQSNENVPVIIQLPVQPMNFYTECSVSHTTMRSISNIIWRTQSKRECSSDSYSR